MKKPYLSKTLWANWLIATLAFIPSVGDWVASNPQAMTVVFAGVNILLRFVTKDKLQLLD